MLLGESRNRRSEEIEMSEQPRRRNKVLVVANRTAASDELIEAASRRAAREPTEFALVVPATPRGLKWAMNMHAGEDDALEQLNRALQRFRDAGLDVVHARIGDPDPVAAADRRGTRRASRLDHRVHVAASRLEVAADRRPRSDRPPGRPRRRTRDARRQASGDPHCRGCAVRARTNAPSRAPASETAWIPARGTGSPLTFSRWPAAREHR